MNGFRKSIRINEKIIPRIHGNLNTLIIRPLWLKSRLLEGRECGFYYTGYPWYSTHLAHTSEKPRKPFTQDYQQIPRVHICIRLLWYGDCDYHCGSVIEKQYSIRIEILKKAKP
jgi:hypothetical protein